MSNLWRVLAIAWLGGFASPVLAEEPPDLDVAPTAIAGEHTPQPSLLERGDIGDNDIEPPDAEPTGP